MSEKVCVFEVVIKNHNKISPSTGTKFSNIQKKHIVTYDTSLESVATNLETTVQKASLLVLKHSPEEARGGDPNLHRNLWMKYLIAHLVQNNKLNGGREGERER